MALQKYMKKLDTKVAQYAKGRQYKLVSYGFEIQDKKPTKTEKGLRLYIYK